MQKTVLVADDDPDVTQGLALRLKRLGLSVVRSPDATHALVGTQRIRPDLVIMDVTMPGGNGLAVAEMLASDEDFSQLPVIIHTGRDDELTRIRCVHPSHYYVQKSPRSWSEIKAIVCRELGIQSDDAVDAAADAQPSGYEGTALVKPGPGPDTETQPEPDTTEIDDRTGQQNERNGRSKRGTVLCIDDDADISKCLKIRLAGYGVEVLRTFNGTQGYWTAVGEVPDVILCDMVMPDGDGGYTFSRLKSHPLTENIPVIILTGVGNPAQKRSMVSLGAAAYLSKPVGFDDLLRELRAFLDLPEQPLGTDRGCLLGARTDLAADRAATTETPSR